MMDILALTGIFHPKSIDEITSNDRGVIQYAGDLFQKKILRGLQQTGTVKISVLNSVFVSGYPVYNKIYIRNKIISDPDFVSFRETSFLNIPLVRLWSKQFSLKKHIKAWATDDLKSEEKVVLVYSLYLPFLETAVYAKKLNPKIRICLIAPDLPQFMSDNRSYIYRGLKWVESKRTNKLLLHADGCVGLTDYMRGALGFDGRPFMRMEGIANAVSDSDRMEKNRDNIILYSGTLARRYGICELVDAFLNRKNRSAELWIIGSGDAEEYIRKKAGEDPQIRLLGQIPNAEVRMLQQKATLLVNPRTNDGEYTKYSFPSKVMEYLASGTPALLYKLPGIPDEYYNYCFGMENTDLSFFTEQLDRCLAMPREELAAIGGQAKQFVLSQKNEIMQGKKLHDFMKKHIVKNG